MQRNSVVGRKRARLELRREEVPTVAREVSVPSLRRAPFGEGHYSVLDLANATRLALLITARREGRFSQQVADVLETMRSVLHDRSQPARVTIQTVFLRDAGEQAECERI